MKKILLPTDFSPNSWNAIAYALQLFKDEACKFYLLNTYTPTIYQVEYLLGNPAQYDIPDPIMETSLEKLKNMEDRIKTDFNNPKHNIETMSVFNTLIPEIKEVVEAKNIDYVIMGTKGATGAKEILFGSNTVHVFKNIKCPLIAIPEDFKFESPHDILFPTDYEIDYSNEHIQPLIDIASLYTARINILNVSFGYELTEQQERNKHKLENYFNGIAHLFHRVGHESVQEAITDFQMKARINLLVMINNKHSFFENLFFKSTINQIGFHLNIPFLLIPAKYKKS
jgi:nucleotide-binding universal stress UspA family protein